MQAQVKFRVATQFSKFPGGRKREHGPFSGEQFREDVALPLLRDYDHVTFDLSGSAGYSSGFLDEAFGELGALFELNEVRRRITIVADDDPVAVTTAWARIEDAFNERQRK